MEGVQDAEKSVVVALCTPTITLPLPAYMEAVEAAIPVVEAAGFDLRVGFTVGNPYISAARSELLRHALDAKADVIVFIDHDVSFRPEDLLKLIETPGEVVAGTYRFKKADEEYMGDLAQDASGRRIGRHADGTETLVLEAVRIPAGFMKITRAGVERFMRAYPHLSYGSPINPSTDLFNHGAHEGVWFGEDFSFSRNWIACGGELLVIPDLQLTHHSADTAYPGNLDEFLQRQPGGRKDPARLALAC